jgi:MFS family permease
MIWAQIKDYLHHVRLFSPNARKFLVGSFFMGFGFSVFWLLLNLYLKQVGFEEGRIGSIISASSVGTVLIAVPAAILIDRFRIKHILMIAAVINGSALMTQAMSTTIWSLRAMSMISGAMWTVHFIAASPFFMRNSSPEERPYLFGINMALSTLVMLATVGFYVTSTTAVWMFFKSKSGIGRRKIPIGAKSHKTA